MSFNELGNKSRGIDYLLFPASHLEKFLSTLIVTTIGFLLVYHLAFYLAAMAADAIMTVRTGHHMENDLFVDAKRNGWGYFYYAWFIMQAIFLLGAVYFHKYSFIKTMFCLFVFVLVLYMINAGFVNVFFNKHLVDWRSHFPFIGINVILENTASEYTPSTHKFLMLPTGVRDVLLFGGKYLAVPVLWTLAFFRLRDKEM
jgi:hypothetical protein